MRFFNNKTKEYKWNEELAYCVGLLASDGNLSKDGRHIAFVSKDKDLVEKFKNTLDLTNKISFKASGYNKNGKYYYIQLGNRNFYLWLNRIGLTSTKSKTIGPLLISKKYFFGFLRGLLDGDGCVTSFKHAESKYPQIRIKFASGSKKFLIWLDSKVDSYLGIKGRIEKIPRLWGLVYYKGSSLKLLREIYRKPKVFSERKYLRAKQLLLQNKGGWCNWQTREA